MTRSIKQDQELRQSLPLVSILHLFSGITSPCPLSAQSKHGAALALPPVVDTAHSTSIVNIWLFTDITYMCDCICNVMGCLMSSPFDRELFHWCRSPLQPSYSPWHTATYRIETLVNCASSSVP